MKKSFSVSLILCFLLLFPTELFCQKFKGERRVYFLDATYSMLTNKVGNNTLWEESKKNLIAAINQINDPATEIVVIAFADDKDPVNKIWIRLEDKATDNGKHNIITQLNKIVPNQYPSSLTNLDTPLKDFIEKESKSDKINYMFLMTDGEHDYKYIKEKPEERIKSWGNCTSPLTFGFHVELVGLKGAASKALKDEINKQDRIWTVQSADVDLNLIRLENEAVLNIKNEDALEIPIYFQGVNHDIINKIVPSLNNSDFSIDNYEIDNDKIILTFKHDKDLSLIPDESQICILLNLPDTPKTFLLTDKINTKILNKKERTLALFPDRFKGKADQYDSFLWSKAANKPYEITIPLKFSKDAVADSGSFAEFTFVDTDGNPIDASQINITINRAAYNGSFRIKPSDKDLSLSFSFPKEVKTGKYKGLIKIKRHNLDRINNSILNENPNPEIIEYTITNSHSLNPLARIFMWIGIAIIVGLALWFCIIKRIKYRKFRNFPKSILIRKDGQIVAQFNVNFKGARKVIIADKIYKQSFLNRLFTGKIKSIISPYFKNRLCFIPQGRNAAAVFGIGYSATPRPIPRNGKAQITNMQDNLQITL